MPIRKKTSNSPRRLLLDINGLIEKLEVDRAAALQRVRHVPRVGERKLGRASTILGDCSDSCPACGVERWYADLGLRIGKAQRQAFQLIAQSAIASDQGLQVARKRAAASNSKGEKIRAEYEACAAKARSQKELALLLGISQPTLRKFQRTRKK